MNKKNSIVKIAYLVGVIIDGFWAIVLAIPSLYLLITNSNLIILNPQTRMVFIIASSLMFGWTFLLLWGYQKPIERRMILLITAFPVVFGILIGTIIGIINGNYRSIIFLIKTFLIIIFMLIAYRKADEIANQPQ